MEKLDKKAMMNHLHKVIIIGSGPAGYTAALYTARANLSPLLFTGSEPGGQLMITTEVENFPGFPNGLLGPEMMELFSQQAQRFGTQILHEHVTKVDLSQKPFRVWVNDDLYHSESVIVSTGATAKWLGIESEKTFGGFGVSACATCDGFFFKNKEVIVIGGGDTAMEEATFLTKFCKKVNIVHRRDSFRASKIMQERALSNEKIHVIWDSAVEEIIGDIEPQKKVTGVRLKNLITGERTDMQIDGVFLAIGHKPNTELFQGILDMDEVGYLKPEPHSSRTKIAGVFVAGDVCDKTYRQAITAAGMGCMAAIDAERYLEAEEYSLRNVI
jgi:thioredoxin reductase (NADPH)